MEREWKQAAAFHQPKSKTGKSEKPLKIRRFKMRRSSNQVMKLPRNDMLSNFDLAVRAYFQMNRVLARVLALPHFLYRIGGCPTALSKCVF